MKKVKLLAGALALLLALGMAPGAALAEEPMSSSRGVVTDKARTVPNGLHQEADGTWLLYQDGRIASGYTGLTEYYGTWYYVENGVLNWGYTGLTNYYGTWYYVENGVLNWGYTGLTQYYGVWYYVENGVLNLSYTGLTKYGETWYLVVDGIMDRNNSGLVEYYGSCYLVVEGVLDWSYTGFISLDNEFCYIIGGRFAQEYTGLVSDDGDWWYLDQGVWNGAYIGMTEYYGTWYFVNYGSLDWNYSNNQYRDPMTGKYFRIQGGVGTIIPDNQVVKPTYQINDNYSNRVIELVNQERAKNGLPPLVNDSKLHEAALTRAKELVELCSHTRPDGRDCFTVLDDYNIGYFGSGENIAAGQTSPEAVMDAWMNSTSHYINIMAGVFNKIGVACVKCNGEYYWVQVFIGD